MKQNERRKDSRVTFTTTIDLCFHDETIHNCSTRDLSCKGVFVPGLKHRQNGDQCRLVIRLTGTEPDQLIEVKGEIVRKTSDGCGFHFKQMDLDSFQHLKNIVYFNSNTPDQLNEDFFEIPPEETFNSE